MDPVEEKRMNLAFDIDDTITDTFDYFIPFVAEYCRVSEDDLREHEISYNNVPADWGMELVPFAKVYFDSKVPDTPGKKEAAQVLRELKDAGHRIVIITKRDNEMYTDCYETTRKELQNLGVPYDKLICTMDKKTACMEEQIDLFFDDSISNAEAVKNAGIPAYVFTSPVNRDRKTDLPRVLDWQEVREVIRAFK